jgi:hypothetical protein
VKWIPIYIQNSPASRAARSEADRLQRKIVDVLKHLKVYDKGLAPQESVAKELFSHFIEIYFIMREAGVKSQDINFALREDFPYLWQYHVTVTKLHEVEVT